MAQKNICFNIFTEETDPPITSLYMKVNFFQPYYVAGLCTRNTALTQGCNSRNLWNAKLSILEPWGYSKNPHFIGKKLKTQRGELTCFSQLLQPFGIKAGETSFLIPLFSIKKFGLFIKYVCESPTHKTVCEVPATQKMSRY